MSSTSASLHRSEPSPGVGAKLWIPVIHLEAGLCSRDRQMPEEINRLVTDSISDVLWTPSEDADANLLAEGVSPDRIDRIGNIMIDSFEMLRENTERPVTLTRGTNRLCELDNLSDAVDSVLSEKKRQPCKIELWDGKTSERVVDSIKEFFS